MLHCLHQSVIEQLLVTLRYLHGMHVWHRDVKSQNVFLARGEGGERVVEAVARIVAAGIPGVEARFTCCDFRRYAGLHRIPEGSLTLVITNPPLGRRVRVPGLRGLFDDLFATAARMLRPEGRLVLTNPFRMESPERSLQLESRRTVDLGGFDCRLEVYRKAPARPR